LLGSNIGMFGNVVAASGGAALVGADDHPPFGAAYLFLEASGTCAEAAEITPDGVNAALGLGDLGVSAALAGGVAVFGATWQNDIGAAYVVEFCALGHAAYPPGAASPENACQVCTPSASMAAFSDRPDDTLCPLASVRRASVGRPGPSS
jgi:hypothetical protein